MAYKVFTCKCRQRVTACALGSWQEFEPETGKREPGLEMEPLPPALNVN